MELKWIEKHSIASKYVCNGELGNHISVGVGQYRIGMSYNRGCFRVMLIWWHLCFLESAV